MVKLDQILCYYWWCFGLYRVIWCLVSAAKWTNQRHSHRKIDVKLIEIWIFRDRSLNANTASSGYEDCMNCVLNMTLNVATDTDIYPNQYWQDELHRPAYKFSQKSCHFAIFLDWTILPVQEGFWGPIWCIHVNYISTFQNINQNKIIIIIIIIINNNNNSKNNIHNINSNKIDTNTKLIPFKRKWTFVWLGRS